ncbi:zf-HC2 domain-containing protein [Actinokineospora sp. PR83]|uniref:zf-HC2 domain-containing protein n=1 Tax=Actinokineospora sp. PR83 TaxID=2884908 RepID=UPI001F29D763|nr:zf-HC2 domain-containing protein [Actinokineospora sp. PR83]MCG8914483.1 zf-HC2 domain-containing protein [Actinokineospora sp. PR83]
MSYREALSARLDGETELIAPTATDAHLGACPACGEWYARAAAMTRPLRVRVAPRSPDLADVILDAAPEPEPEPSRDWWPRLLLGVVAVAQLALAMGQVLGVDTAHGAAHAPGGLADHLSNESTAWNLAIGIGLGWAALRPRAAGGLAPLLSGFVLALTAYSTVDLVAGVVPWSRVLGHGLLVAGLALVVVVGRTAAPGPGDRNARGSVERAVASEWLDQEEVPPGSTAQSRRKHLVPVAEHRAA